MGKSTALRLGGFVAAIGASAALVASATGATGAYFTESHAGAVNTSTGGVHVSTSDLQLNFTSLLPGEFQTRQVAYTSTGTGPEDIWLVLPTGGTAAAFNGVPQPGPVPLGRYGHFAVTAPDGSFTSYNLASNPTSGGPSCTVDNYGRGGSNQQAADRTDYNVPYCPVPGAILLSYGLPAGHSASAAITFGFTKLMNNPAQEDLPLAPLAQFKIVATQHGIMPNDPNN